MLEVDAFDRVELDREGGLWADEHRTEAWVNQTFEQIGLPDPALTGWRYETVVC